MTKRVLAQARQATHAITMDALEPKPELFVQGRKRRRRWLRSPSTKKHGIRTPVPDGERPKSLSADPSHLQDAASIALSSPLRPRSLSRYVTLNHRFHSCSRSTPFSVSPFHPQQPLSHFSISSDSGKNKHCSSFGNHRVFSLRSVSPPRARLRCLTRNT